MDATPGLADDTLPDPLDPATGAIPLEPARPGWRAALHGQIGGLPGPFWWLFLGTVVNRAGTFIEPFFVLYLTGPRGVSASTAGVVLTVWGAGSLLSQPIGGFLTDRFGRRTTLVVGLTATAGALLALSTARDLAVIAALVFVVGTVGDLYRPAVSAAVADLVDEPERARAYALMFWAINLGFSVASTAAGVLLHVLGFGVLFVLDALTTLGFGLLSLRFVPETRPEPHHDAHPARLADPVLLLARDRLLLAATGIVLVYAVLYGQVGVAVPLAITHSGLDASVYGYVIAINGVLIVVGQPLTLRFFATRSRRVTLPAGLALVGIGIAATGLCDRPWQFALTVVVWTVGEIATAGSFQALVAALAPEHMRGRYAGALGLAWGASGLAGPLFGAGGYALSPALLWTTCLVIGCVSAAGQFWLLGALAARTGTPVAVP